MLKKFAAWIAHSALFASSRRLYTQNCQNWNLPLGKSQKLMVGLYLILKDYAEGLFPPSFHDQQATHANEIACRSVIGGFSIPQSLEADMRKPFWSARSAGKYLRDFSEILRCLESCRLAPPARLLELGSGSGWTAEFLATRGYDVTGTSLVELEIADARKRIASLQAKGLGGALRFEVAAMESVADQVGPREHYDAVLVYEALHHAFDWPRTLQSAFACLKPGGWLLICGEPNLAHTAVSYRVAKLSNTHEIGFSGAALIRQLRQTGFQPVQRLSSPIHFWIRPHWIRARKPLQS